jgi:hypothetical protein
MRNIRNTIGLVNVLYYPILLLLISGCASGYSAFLQGGTVVPEDYQVQKVIVSYQAEGTVPERIHYFLVETDRGLAIFERSEDGSGSLMQTHWQDDQCDHFGAWVSPPVGIISKRGLGGPAYEFVVPFDRSKEAKKFVYEKGAYRVRSIDGIWRPVPNNPETKPVATLFPK